MEGRLFDRGFINLNATSSFFNRLEDIAWHR